MKHLDHIGIAVNNLDDALSTYVEVLGLECEGKELVEDQQLKTALLIVGDTHLELLEPTSHDSNVGRFLEKRGEGIHHLAFYVDDIDKAMDDYKSKGMKFIDEKPRQGAYGKTIAFMHPKATNGVLIELVEKK